MMSRKPPQLSPDWHTGIYTGDGVIAEPKAYAVVYSYNKGQSGGTTPSFATVDQALAFLYNKVDLWDSARIKTVPHTAQTRHSA